MIPPEAPSAPPPQGGNPSGPAEPDPRHLLGPARFMPGARRLAPRKTEMSPGFTSLLWFGAVIALIPLALWFVKRSPMGRLAGQGGMRQVGAMAISASQRIVTVEVGRGDSRCWLVLGVTPNSINTLHTMLPQDESVPAAPASPNTAFAQLLQRLQGRGSDAR